MGLKNNNVRIVVPPITIPTKRSLDNDGHKGPLQVPIQPNIGLESDVRTPVIQILNKSLANEAVLSQKTRSAYWNARGQGFLELHVLFEAQYKQLNEMTNRIAERARMLGGMALASYEGFLAQSQLVEQSGFVPDVLHLLADHESLIRLLREDIRKCTDEFEDEGTIDLLVNVMSLHEKMAWMLRAYIEQEPAHGESQKRRFKNE